MTTPNNKNKEEYKNFCNEEAIACHLTLLGDRQSYCLVGGKHECNEKKSKFEIPKGNVFTKWISHDNVIDFIKQKNSRGEQVWISLNDKEAGVDANKGVNKIHAIWFDIDAPREDKNKIATETEKRIAYKNCKELKTWISNEFGAKGFIACSGNGYHLFFPIEAYDLIAETQREEFNNKQKNFLKRISKESGIGIDATTDIRRVTQAIGALNLKIPDKPLPTYWIDKPTDEDIEKARKANFVLLEAILNTKLEQLKPVTTAVLHPEFEDLLKTDTKLKDLYEGNWKGYGFESRSEAEASLVTLLCMNGFSDAEIKEIMQGCQIGKWQEKDASYHNLTIENARQFVTDDVEDNSFIPPPQVPPFEFNLGDNMIKDYMNFMHQRTDAFSEYHFSVICALLSRIIDRQIYVELTQGCVYPNLWFMIIGDSTISRKTTAMQLGKGVIKRVFDRDIWATDNFFYPQDFSPEAFIELMSKEPHGAWWLDECAGFLALADRTYMSGIKDLLSNLYECGDHHRKLRTKRKSTEQTEFNIVDSYLTILFATTPDRFSENTNVIDLTSGWLVRFLYLFPRYKKRWRPFTEADENANDDLNILISKLDKIQQKIQAHGERRIKFESDAIAIFQEWQKTREDSAAERQDSIELAILGRLEIYALKLAIVFAVSQHKFLKEKELKISVELIEEAIRLIETYFEVYERDIIELAMQDEQTNLQEKIIATLKRLGGQCTRRVLLQRLHRTLKDVGEALDALEESGEIKVGKTDTGTNRSATIITLMNTCCSVARVARVSTRSNKKNVKNNEENNNNDKKDNNDTRATQDTSDTRDTVATQKVTLPEKEKYQRMSNPVFGFFHDWCEIIPEQYTPKTEFYAAFCEYCKEKKLAPFSEKKFLAQMKLLTKMEDGQRGPRGEQKRVWLGVVVTHNNDKITRKHGKQDNHDFLYLNVQEYFCYIKKEIRKNIEKDLNKEKGAYGAYGAYENDTFLLEWLKSKSKNCGTGICRGCNNEKNDLWAFKINDTEGGFCLDCINDAIEQELKKTEGTEEENKKRLVCVCGKRFDTVEVLHKHQAKCNEFQRKQDLEANKCMKI